MAGGNDVAMIQEAAVGVGIVGKEGQQAARAADFSFGKFKFLRRFLWIFGNFFSDLSLIFVHGQLSYKRTAFIGHYCFHKSLFIALIQVRFGITVITKLEVLFAIDSGFSGVSFFSGLALISYNTFFTSLPVLFFRRSRTLR